VDVVSNDVESRVTVGRSILGSTPLANDNDVPPGGISSVGTLGILPFFVTVQRGLPGIFDLDLTLAYSATELLIAGIAPGSPEEQALVVASFSTGTCTLGGAVCSDDAGCGANGPCLGAGYTALTTTVNTALHTATTPGVTSTGTFAVLHPDVLAGGFLTPRIPGGGNPATDCRGEWEVPNPTNTPFLDTKGLPNQKQTCVDGDPACDADLTANGTCTFRVAICLDQSDAALPTCTAGGTTGYLVKKPAPIAPKDPVDAANGTVLVNVVKALGGTVTGPKQNDVQFTSPLPAPICTAFARVKVPLRSSTKVGKRTIVGCPELAGKCKDRDKLKLACVPAS
jgi:hypothetical protein